MALRNTSVSWGWPARGLHWLLAIVVIGLWILGKVMVDVPDADLMRKFELYQLHKSIGFTVFALALIRLAWRLANPAPDLPEGAPRWERLAAGTSHALLYVLLLAIPVSGYLMASASPLGIPTIVFGVLPLPSAAGPDAALEANLKQLHEALGNLLALVLSVHLAAALKHHFIDRDMVLRRMIRG